MRRYRLYNGASRRYKRYKNYKGHSKFNGKFQHHLFNTRIGVLNDYADHKDRKGFLSYINRQPARRKLFSFWKGQRKSYLQEKDIDMVDSAMGNRW